MKDALRTLANFRLEQAQESLEAAQILFDSEKYRPSVNRAYYAMFYSVLALLALEGKGSSKHSGIISQFDRLYIKNGVFEKETSKWLHEAFDLRQRSDYQEMFLITPERARRVLENAATFIKTIRSEILKPDSSSGMSASKGCTPSKAREE